MDIFDKASAIFAGLALAFLILMPAHRPATYCSAPPCAAPVVQDGGSGIIPCCGRVFRW